MNLPMYLKDRYPGEALMLAAIEEAVAQNREACRVQGQRAVCWLYPEEIARQQLNRRVRIEQARDVLVTGRS